MSASAGTIGKRDLSTVGSDEVDHKIGIAVVGDIEFDGDIGDGAGGTGEGDVGGDAVFVKVWDADIWGCGSGSEGACIEDAVVVRVDIDGGVGQWGIGTVEATVGIVVLEHGAGD